MACELDEAYDRVRDALPPEWTITGMDQDGGGWHVHATKRYNGTSLGARAGSLTKALNRLADKLEVRYAQST